MESTISTPIEAAAAALATAADSPMTATGEETLALVRDLAQIAHHLSELTAATRDRWAAWILRTHPSRSSRINGFASRSADAASRLACRRGEERWMPACSTGSRSGGCTK